MELIFEFYQPLHRKGPGSEASTRKALSLLPPLPRGACIVDFGCGSGAATLILAYIIITAGEVLVSITILEFSYSQAPKTLKSFIMGLFLLSITVGNLLTAEVNGVIKKLEASGYSFLTGANYYWTFTAAMLVTACLYVVWSQFYRGQTFIQGNDD